MLEWYQDLYVSDLAAKHVRRTIRRINQSKFTPDIYVLTLPGNEHNVMDIVPSKILLQKIARQRCPMIIGVAKGIDDAYGLMQEILMETYENTGNFHVKDYLKDR